MGGDLDEFWALQPHKPEAVSASALSVQPVETVEPLEAQFGVATPKTVPDALYTLLFDQPEPTAAEVIVTEHDPNYVPMLNTYAILDAAKVANLPEVLEACGLDHRCLFKGVAYNELKDVAPWIVRLEEGNVLTRNLFTSSDAPWHLWDCEPGIYLRSRGTLDEMWGHFRKFTRVQDEHGKWLYWRFWEPKWAARVLVNLHPNQRHRFLSGIMRVIAVTSSGKLDVLLNPEFANRIEPSWS